MRKLSTRDIPSTKEDNIWQWLLAPSEISHVFKWRRTEDRGHQFQKEFWRLQLTPKGWLHSDFFVIKKKKNHTWLHLLWIIFHLSKNLCSICCTIAFYLEACLLDSLVYILSPMRFWVLHCDPLAHVVYILLIIHSSLSLETLRSVKCWVKWHFNICYSF